MQEIIKILPVDKNFHKFQNLLLDLYTQEELKYNQRNKLIQKHLQGCYMIIRDNTPVGRFAFYNNPELKYNEQPAASIGYYECINNSDASQQLLQHAINLAKKKGYKWLIGPMDGSTWNNYRFSQHNKYPNFFMEPYHHIYYNEQFINAGFQKIAEYSSNVDTTLEYNSKKLKEFEQYYITKGAVFRNIDIDNLEKDLYKIGLFSIEAFSKNFLYTPINTEDFAQKYLPYKKYIDPKLVWIVENLKGEVQAFIFAIRDYFDVSGKTLIIKSMARKADSSFKGIGRYLTEKIIEIAKEEKIEKIIHAFMINDNISFQMSKKFSVDAYKTYALYGMEL